MRQPDLVIEGMPNWKAFCVYAWKRQSQYLYVGVTNNGYRRPFYGHHIIDKAEHIADGDLFEFWFFPSRFLAEDFEAEMIREQRPIYNQAVPYRKGLFIDPIPQPKKCLRCKKYIPKGYALWLCGNCERLKILRTAARLVRLVTEEWEKAEPEVKWHRSWETLYSCEKRKCAACKQPFEQTVWWQAFCSPECEVTTHLIQVESVELKEELQYSIGRVTRYN